MTMLITEHDFELPKGYVDGDGTLHRLGVMRLATAADEILPMKDPRVQGLPAYLIVILLSRVITKLGTLSAINPGTIEGLFSEDLTFLQTMYNRINGLSPPTDAIECPRCTHRFAVAEPVPGGSSATPWNGSTTR
jgi:hypothetical protein